MTDLTERDLLSLDFLTTRIWPSVCRLDGLVSLNAREIAQLRSLVAEVQRWRALERHWIGGATPAVILKNAKENGTCPPSGDTASRPQNATGEA